MLEGIKSYFAKRRAEKAARVEIESQFADVQRLKNLDNKLAELTAKRIEIKAEARVVQQQYEALYARLKSDTQHGEVKAL